MRLPVLLVLGGCALALANHPHPLSDSEHNKGSEHDKKFDHEAFLGKDTASEFDELTPEKSKEKLAYVYFAPFCCLGNPGIALVLFLYNT